MIERPEKVLREVFGYDRFRHHQKEIIDTLIAGGDCLVLMPTGGGKSLCYQVPALVMDGTAVVVSPLIALMQDQVAALRQFGIDAGLSQFNPGLRAAPGYAQAAFRRGPQAALTCPRSAC